MAADASAPCLTRSSASLASTVRNKQVFVFHKEGFQLPAPSQVLMNGCKYNLCICVPKWIQEHEGEINNQYLNAEYPPTCCIHDIISANNALILIR